MFESEQMSLQDVTMSMYPCATYKAAHWQSFITGVTKAAPLNDKNSPQESDSDDQSEQYIGERTPSFTPEAAGLFNCHVQNYCFTGPSSTPNRDATMRLANPEKLASSSRLEPAGPSATSNRSVTPRSASPEKKTSSSELEPAGPSPTHNGGPTMRPASPEKQASSSTLEPPGPHPADNRGTRRSTRTTTKAMKSARPVSPITEPSPKRRKGERR